MADTVPPMIHLVSDSTGETLAAAVRAVSAQFVGVEPQFCFHRMTRKPEDVETVFQAIAPGSGLIVHTVMKPELRKMIEQHAAQRGMESVALLEPLIGAMRGSNSATLSIPLCAACCSIILRSSGFITV